MKFTIKNLKNGGLGMEGQMYSASLYADGKKVAHAYDSGNGGEICFDWVGLSPNLKHGDRKIFDEFTRQAFEKYPDCKKGLEDNKDCKFDYWSSSARESYFAALCDDHEVWTKLKRACKKKTIFVLDDEDPAVGYRFVKAPWSPKVKVWLNSKYSYKHKIRFLNEEVA